MKKPDVYDVIIHFPNWSIILSGVEKSRARHIEEKMTLGKLFRVWDGDNHWYLVNPHLVTSVENKVAKPF